MSRRGSLTVLALSVALVVGAFVALIGGMALGAWRPAGPAPPTATPRPVPGAVEYGQFLDDVRAGRVNDVFQDGDSLQVNAVDGPYIVELPFGDPDVFGDVRAAAEAGGVPTPQFGSNPGPDETPEPLSYAAFLEQVEAGRVYDVFHNGDRLMVSAVDGTKDVVVPAGVDVLHDIEAAALAGDVPAPSYTKVPAKPEG